MSDGKIRFETTVVQELDPDTDKFEDAMDVMDADDDAEVWDFVSNLYAQAIRSVVDEDEFVSAKTEWQRVGDDDE